MIQPCVMSPSFQSYLWGGEKLRTLFQKECPSEIIAESWEVSCHKTAPSSIVNGVAKGMTLAAYIEQFPMAMGSVKQGSADDFPILVKLIDAQHPLSLQVHPGDAYAKQHEGQSGKNEIWYVMDCEEDAEIVIGFETPLTREELETAMENDTILSHVKKTRVSPGDCFLIPAGTIHAIGGGILIAEVQQSSDVTYRVHDYNRVGADGQKRPLHQKQALETIDTTLQAICTSHTPSIAHAGYQSTMLCDWEYFQVALLRLTTNADLHCPATHCQSLLLLEGSLTLRWQEECIPLVAGQSVFLPASLGAYRLEGEGKTLLITA